MSPPQTEPPPSGLPDEEQDEELALGVPAGEDDADRGLPGLPEGVVDTAG